MPRYFEFKDDKSSKFWEIELHGSSYSVRYGKIGTTGQSQTKEFADDAVAKKEYDKLVAEKTKKGYLETAAGAVASTIVKAPVRNPEVERHAMKSAQRSADDWSDEDEDDDDQPQTRKDASGAAGGAPSISCESGMRRFEFEDDKSSKFWQISIEGSSFTVCYGRIGADGQTQTKDFASDSQAQKEYEKLVQEKIKKGYEEVESDEQDGEDENAEDGVVFASLGIEEWDPEEGIADPRGSAFKIGLTYEEDDEEGMKWSDKLAAFLEDPKASEVKALVVGSWGSQSMCEGENSAAVVEALVAAREQLPNLKAIFVADVDAEECEISWIQQSDMSPLLDAYPDLTHFRVRGGTELELGSLKHSRLESLVLESGGLSTEVVRAVAGAHLPELVYLELWLGTDNYGGNYTIEDLRPILEGKVFPKLQYLGLCNSMLTDKIAIALTDATILKRIQVLDLSMGTLGDKGGEALLQNPLISKLSTVDVGHHYMTPDMIKRMEAQGNFIHLDRVEKPDYFDDDDDDDDDDKYDGRYCEVSE